MPEPLRLPLTPAERTALFTHFYETRHFGQPPETATGPGATLMNTRSLRRGLQALIDTGFIHRLADLGCGDFNWQSAMDLSRIDYLGLDIAPPLIAKNTRRHAQNNLRFETIDAVESVPSGYDTILCRDLLPHLSLADCAHVINYIRTSGATFVLLTSFYPAQGRIPLSGQLNKEITRRWWRPLNVQRAPFHFPRPLFSIHEDEPGKRLECYRAADLPELDPATIALPTEPITAQTILDLPFIQALIELPFIHSLYAPSRPLKPNIPTTLLIRRTPGSTQGDWLQLCALLDAENSCYPIVCEMYDESKLAKMKKLWSRQ